MFKKFVATNYIDQYSHFICDKGILFIDDGRKLKKFNFDFSEIKRVSVICIREGGSLVRHLGRLNRNGKITLDRVYPYDFWLNNNCKRRIYGLDVRVYPIRSDDFVKDIRAKQNEYKLTKLISYSKIKKDFKELTHHRKYKVEDFLDWAEELYTGEHYNFHILRISGGGVSFGLFDKLNLLAEMEATKLDVKYKFDVCVVDNLDECSRYVVDKFKEKNSIVLSRGLYNRHNIKSGIGTRDRNISITSDNGIIIHDNMTW